MEQSSIIKNNGFELSEKNVGQSTIHIYGAPNTSRIDRVDWEKIQMKIVDTDLLESSNNFENGDVIYFAKTSTIVRDKIRDHCIDNKIEFNKTNRIGYATTFVVNKDEVELFSNMKFTEYNMVITDDLLNYTNIKVSSFGKKHEFTPKNYAYAFLIDTSKRRLKYTAVYSNFDVEKLLSTIQILELWSTDPSKYKIVFDQTLSKQINNIPIDLETFDQLYNMLNGDKKDIMVAASIITNCDRDKSRIAILLLLNRFNSKLMELKGDDKIIRAMYGYFKGYHFNTDPIDFLNILLKQEKQQLSPSDKIIIDHHVLKMVKIVFSKVESLQVNNIELAIR